MLLYLTTCAFLVSATYPPSETPKTQTPSLTSIHNWPTAGFYAFGALSAFAAHESGHLLVNAILGNQPRFVLIKGFDFIPFVAISPELSCNDQGCTQADGTAFSSGRSGMYAISTAGFTVQHIGSEIILTADPYLHYHEKPWQKGFLTFNIALSIGYAVSSLLNIEESHGDAGGAAQVSGIAKPWFGTLLILPAIMDTLRFIYPDWVILPWLSRTGKSAMVGLTCTF